MDDVQLSFHFPECGPRVEIFRVEGSVALTTFFPRHTVAAAWATCHRSYLLLISWADVAFLLFRAFSFHFQLPLRHLCLFGSPLIKSHLAFRQHPAPTPAYYHKPQRIGASIHQSIILTPKCTRSSF